MSRFLGKTKQKSKHRRESKEQIELNKRLMQQEDSPFRLLFGSKESIEKHDSILKQYLKIETETGLYRIGYDKDNKLVDSNGLIIEQLSGEGILEAVDKHIEKQKNQTR